MTLVESINLLYNDISLCDLCEVTHKASEKNQYFPVCLPQQPMSPQPGVSQPAASVT
jgi:hypothetical protein